MKIGILRSCALGDAVQCTPVLQQIRADFPQASIHFFTTDNVTTALEGCPFIDELHPLPTPWLANSKTGLRTWNQISRLGPFDLFFSLEATWLRNLGIMLVKAKRKLGIRFAEGSRKPSPFTDTVTMSGDPTKVKEHTSARYINAWCQLMGTTDRGFGYDMRHLLTSSTTSSEAICLAPGTGSALDNYPTKAWGAANYIALGKALLNQGQKVLYVGGPNDLGGAPVPAGALDLLGKTSIAEVATILSMSRLLIGNDSGLFHLAQGLGCPVLGIFGPTSPDVTGVFRSAVGKVLQADLACMPCHQRHCHAPQVHDLNRPFCMSTVTVQRVLSEILTA